MDHKVYAHRVNITCAELVCSHELILTIEDFAQVLFLGLDTFEVRRRD